MGSGGKCVVVSDVLEGGAATATNRLVDSLAALPAPIERWHFSVGTRGAGAPWEISLDPGRKRPSLERMIKNVSLPMANAMRHRRHTQTFLNRVTETRPALLNFHNIHACGLNHESLRQLPAGITLVWTLHDCWPFRTEAFRWENSQLKSVETTMEDRPEPEARGRRERFFRERADIVLVAPSKWMALEARKHVPRETRIEHIPYGMDLHLFSPLPPPQARAKHGLSATRAWIGYSSTWASTRKGTDILCAAMAKLDCQQLGLLLWGEEPKFDWPAGLEVKRMGPMRDMGLIRELYSACDLFVCPSRADNLPNAVLESLACGTPVIGSNVGGIPDMARPGETGWLFEADRPENCATAINEALKARADWPRYRATCREVAERDYGTALQAQRYARLFHELIMD